jgi:hypothetical protein
MKWYFISARALRMLHNSIPDDPNACDHFCHDITFHFCMQSTVIEQQTYLRRLLHEYETEYRRVRLSETTAKTM